MNTEAFKQAYNTMDHQDLIALSACALATLVILVVEIAGYL